MELERNETFITLKALEFFRTGWEKILTDEGHPDVDLMEGINVSVAVAAAVKKLGGDPEAPDFGASSFG